jgi:hypothetical protein
MNDLDDWDYAASRLLKAQAEATRLEAEIERLRGLVTKYEAEMATCESCSEALYEGAKLVPLRTADQPTAAPLTPYGEAIAVLEEVRRWVISGEVRFPDVLADRVCAAVPADQQSSVLTQDERDTFWNALLHQGPPDKT